MQPTDPSHLAPAQPGAPAADDHAPMGPPPAETIARGYEADTFDAKSVVSVPILVILFFVLAFGTVTVIFKFIAYPSSDGKSHPAAAERSKRPLNDRMAGISRSKDGDQPRLEPLRLRTGGDLARAVPRPELPEGNPPEIHPEELRATKDRYPALFATGSNKLGVDKALELSDATLKGLFPVQANGAKPLQSQHVPTASNAGRGAEESVVEAPPAPKVEANKGGLPKIPVAPPEPPKTEEKKK